MENQKQAQEFTVSYFLRLYSALPMLPKWTHFLPWTRDKVIITNDFLEHRKRNWYLVSVDHRKFHFQNIVGIDVNKNLFGADITIISTGSNDIKIRGFSKSTASTISTLASENIARNTQRGTTDAMADAISKAINKTNAPSQLSVADELKKLKELLDQGIINQEDFDQQKAQLLKK